MYVKYIKVAPNVIHILIYTEKHIVGAQLCSLYFLEWGAHTISVFLWNVTLLLAPFYVLYIKTMKTHSILLFLSQMDIYINLPISNCLHFTCNHPYTDLISCKYNFIFVKDKFYGIPVDTTTNLAT